MPRVTRTPVRSTCPTFTNHLHFLAYFWMNLSSFCYQGERLSLPALPERPRPVCAGKTFCWRGCPVRPGPENRLKHTRPVQLTRYINMSRFWTWKKSLILWCFSALMLTLSSNRKQRHWFDRARCSLQSSLTRSQCWEKRRDLYIIVKWTISAMLKKYS